MGHAYSFMIELLMHHFPRKFKNPLSPELLFHSLKRYLLDTESNTAVPELLNHILSWKSLLHDEIEPYSFDQETDLVKQQGGLFMIKTPISYHRWLLDGARYKNVELGFIGTGYSMVATMEEQNELYIPEDESGSKELNREMAAQEYASLTLLLELGIDEIKSVKTYSAAQVLSAILPFSANRSIRYQQALELALDQGAKKWGDAYKLIPNPWLGFLPYFDETIQSICQISMENHPEGIQLDQRDYQNIFELFTHKAKAGQGFDRFKISYDVWLRPLIRIGDLLFCPIAFLSTNHWFYAFSQLSLTQDKSKGRVSSETQKMERLLQGAAKSKWEFEELNPEGKGDADLVIRDGKHTLLIQMKRTYFRLDSRATYFENLVQDQKAADQLNAVEKRLIDCGTETKSQIAGKWIVSNSFEGIGTNLDGCRKVNHFELLKLINDPAVKTLEDLLEAVVQEKVLAAYCGEFPIDQEAIGKYIQQVHCFDPQQTEEYIKDFDAAVKFTNEKAYELALPRLKSCLERWPNDGEAHFVLADAYVGVFEAMGRRDFDILDLAIEHYLLASSILQNDVRILRHLFLALLDRGAFFDGIKLAKQLIRDFPFYDDIQAIYDRAYHEAIRKGLLRADQISQLSKTDQCRS
jgi:tetratricopeptide (TPR) repeat protein